MPHVGIVLPRRRCRRNNSRRRRGPSSRVATTTGRTTAHFLILCVIISIATTTSVTRVAAAGRQQQQQQQQQQQHEGANEGNGAERRHGRRAPHAQSPEGKDAAACGDGSGSSSSSSCGLPPEPTEDGTRNPITISSDEHDGTITLRDERYPPSEYGHRIMREVRKIRRSAPALLERLDRAEEEEEEEAASGGLEDAQEEVRKTVSSVSTNLVEALLSLASIHVEEWMQFALDVEGEFDSKEEEEEWSGGDGDTNDYDRLLLRSENERHSSDHFSKASNAYEAAISVYERLWRSVALLPRARSLFHDLDREAIAAGLASVHVLLADARHRRFAEARREYEGSEEEEEDCAAAYRHLLRAEEWCRRSLSILGVDDGDDDDDPRDDAGGRRSGWRGEDEDDDVRRAAMSQTRETVAFVHVRLGAILVDMYALGYTLSPESESSSSAFTKTAAQGPSSSSSSYAFANPSAPLGDGERRILDLTQTKISRGLSLYARLAEEEGSPDYRLNVADARNYAGIVEGYRLDWIAAASHWEEGLSLYLALFDEYRDAGMVPEAEDVAGSVVQTTRSAWEAHLNLPGRTEEAKVAFRRHLVYRRYLESRAGPDRPLADGREEEDAYYYGASEYDGGVGDSPRDDETTLNAYRRMLDEYLKMQSEYPPDGSYFDMEFDALGGNPSYVQHDKVYEGSLRSAIGSLQLSRNKLWEARGELELAVSLLSDGADDGYGDSYEAYDENGEMIEYPVRLELANALLNLSYALLGLKQWRSSFEAFEWAMDLYASELAEGETPMNHSEPSMMEMEDGNQASWGERLASYVKGSVGMDEGSHSLYEDESQENDQSKEEPRYINLEDYQIMENTTASRAGVI